MNFKNEIMLITYADSMGENLNDLHYLLNKHYSKAVGGVHILPFFPSSADRGFAPMRYDVIDEKFGTFDDVKSLSKDYYLMFDYMVNHISAHSPYYLDFLKNKDNSKYKDFFIRYKDFWDNGEPTDEQVDIIYKRKPRAPYVYAEFQDGTREKVWCTFSNEQIDLDLSKNTTIQFTKATIQNLCEKGASVLRLDAFAYAIKKAGTNCFFIEPDIWDLLNSLQEVTNKYDVTILPEVHEHYTMQLKIASQGFWIYDFALPVLTLHALYNHNGEYLKHWLEISPKKQFTTLDTHDGIGIVDVKDLLPDDEIEKVKSQLYKQGANVKKIYSSEAYNNLDVYQINSTYYSALGNNDKAYLLARAIQFFAPGIPQVYYVGMLAGENDIELMEKTKNGRDINRHYYSIDEVEMLQDKPVIKKLKELMELRNSHPAFALDGDIEISADKDLLQITRAHNNDKITLKANLTSYDFEIV